MILDRIVAVKREEVALLKRQGITPPADEPPPVRGFARALATPEVAIIAEAKKASPSKGVIRPDFDPALIARQYEEAGARAMSVLTDRQFFQGNLAYLGAARAASTLPVLRKDFIIHALQVEEAQVHGADAILLIAAILDTAALRDLREMAEGLTMDVLVEVHDEEELDRALAAGARLIGINNRNLRDFTVDLDRTFTLKRRIPQGLPVVSESGIRDHGDIKRLAAAGVQAALVGETLMRAPAPGQALRLLRGETS